ncbi:NAD-dependent epimerase/dehydratase family protein, partial [bacterium]|nr:NAD-dependent epimerase/dehydratase family protein [bacterium]
MSTILVSGGAGFVGSHLCRKLLTQGHTVLCLDNLYTGSADNISDLNESSRFVFSVHDVTVPYPAKKIDYIFNLACPASPVHYQAQPVTTFKTAVIGTINMLELARQCGARLLQASTSEIYGDPLVHPQPETYWGNVNPIGIRSCYDEGKRAGETLCADYERQFGTEVRIARIFNTYGPSMNRNDGRVVSNFIIQALEKKPLTIYGDGSQT